MLSSDSNYVLPYNNSFICSLFSDTIISLNSISNVCMVLDNELGRMWKKPVLA